MLFGQSGNEKLIVGYDLGDEYAQISYLGAQNDSPETLSMVAGEEAYNIPVALCKREGVNQWYFGKEAIKMSGELGLTLIKGLFTLAKQGQPITLEDNQFDPVALLALFFKRSLGMLFSAIGNDKIGGIMLTCQGLDDTDSRVLEKMISIAKPKTETIVCQSHEESFYYYMLGSQPMLLEGKTILFQRQGEELISMLMECNKQTTPKVVYSQVQSIAFPVFPEEEQEEIDRELALRIGKALDAVSPDAVYLIGEDFREEMIPVTLDVLCRKCRIFQGSNLYSKGACISMREHYYLPSEAGQSFVYLGREKLKANIGMNLLKQGEDSYLALLDAGNNWFDAKKTVELYIQNQKSLEITVTSLVGRESYPVEIVLEGIADGISRLRLLAYMEQPDQVTIEVFDMGFGEIRSATETVWKKIFEV